MCVTYACPKLYVTSFPVLVSVSVQLQPIVLGIGYQAPAQYRSNPNLAAATTDHRW